MLEAVVRVIIMSGSCRIGNVILRVLDCPPATQRQIDRSIGVGVIVSSVDRSLARSLFIRPIFLHRPTDRPRPTTTFSEPQTHGNHVTVQRWFYSTDARDDNDDRGALIHSLKHGDGILHYNP